MKIAFLVGRFPTLSKTFILDQIVGLIERGHEVDIFAGSKGKDPKVHPDVREYDLLAKTYYRYSPIKAIRLFIQYSPKNSLVLFKSLNIFKYGKNALSLRLFFATLPFLKTDSYDIIHCHFGSKGTLGVLLRDLGAIKGKVITSFHGYDANAYPQRYGNDVYKFLFQKVDLCTVNTDFTGERVKALGCPEDKIVKLPVGLNITKFPFIERKLNSVDNIKVLTVGRLVEKKGLKYSIKAVAKVLKTYPNLQYQIVGDGALRNQLHKLIRQLDIEDKVKLLGWMNQDEVRQLYAKAHIFILSSVTDREGDQEGQGLVLQEAQAMGLPVISTLHNGIPEGVLDGKSGFLVPERDVDAIALKLQQLILHPEIWPEMGRAGRQFVKNHYDIKKLNDRLVEIYQRLLREELP